jgi:hypothetical protein
MQVHVYTGEMTVSMLKLVACMLHTASMLLVAACFGRALCASSVEHDVHNETHECGDTAVSSM